MLVANAAAAKAAGNSGTVVKRVTRRSDDAHGGGAWKVAFADFCLALLCLFLVMWLMAVRQSEELQDLLKASGGNLLDEGRGRLPESLGSPPGAVIEREPLPTDGSSLAAQQAPRDANPASAARQEPRLTKAVFESSADMAELAILLAKLSEQAGLAGNVQSVITPYGLRVTLHDTDKAGMFNRGSAVANERFVALFRKIGPIFSQIANQMLIIGHTDSAQYADRGPAGISNWTLSSDRAVAARGYLMMGGMPAGSVLQVVGLADRAPYNVHDTAAAENRRIELVILTAGQAEAVSAMFRAPEETQMLVEGVSTSVPNRDVVAALRGQLVTSRTP
jgi:chemotaxis protein MotB